MKKIVGILLTTFMLALAGQSFASCDVPSDRASDGSRCGGRSASEKPGGR